MNTIKQKELMINNMRISYCEKITDTSEKITIFLHGWGSNKESFMKLFPLRQNFIALDFPAFGKSAKLSKSFDLNDYAVFLESFIHKVTENLKNDSDTINIEFVVHSFGGRVLLKYLDNSSASYSKIRNINITNIICMGVPFYRHLTQMQKFQIQCSKFLAKNKYTNYIKNKIKPIFSFVFQNKNSDYTALSEDVMKKTFQNIVNEDVSIYLDNFAEYEKNLKLIWGENDEAAPLYYAKNVHEKYPQSELCIISNAGHFPWIDNFEEVKKNF